MLLVICDASRTRQVSSSVLNMCYGFHAGGADTDSCQRQYPRGLRRPDQTSRPCCATVTVPPNRGSLSRNMHRRHPRVPLPMDVVSPHVNILYTTLWPQGTRFGRVTKTSITTVATLTGSETTHDESALLRRRFMRCGEESRPATGGE